MNEVSYEISDGRSQMTENSLPIVFCHLFSVLCFFLTPET